MNRYPIFSRESIGLNILSLLCFLSFVFITTRLDASFVQYGETLTVVAHSGLSLREHPGVHHETLLVIPYGHEVERVIEEGEVPDQMGYISGNWVKVDYHGLEGFVFDAYLSQLPLVSHHDELDNEGLSVPEKIYAWAVHHLDPVYFDDSTEYCANLNPSHVFEHFTNEQSIRVLTTDQIIKSILILHDVRIMEVYHLALDMFNDRSERNEYVENTIIIQDVNGEISEIRMTGDTEIIIRRTMEGEIRLSAQVNIGQMVSN